MRLRFPTTEWGRVTAGRSSSDELVRQYLPALLAFVRRFLNCSADRAEDLVQGFVLSQWLERNLCAAADPAKGRFRTFLITALKRYVINQLRRPNLPTCRDDEIESLGDGEQVSEAVDAFDVAWARQVLAETIHRMREYCATYDRSAAWIVFSKRLLEPIFGGAQPIEYEQLCDELELDRAARAANLLVTGKRMYERILREVVSDYAGPQADVEDEIRDLIRILSHAGAESGDDD